jgi:hypothetical protein
LGPDGRGNRPHWTEERAKTRTIGSTPILVINEFLMVTLVHLYNGYVIGRCGARKTIVIAPTDGSLHHDSTPRFANQRIVLYGALRKKLVFLVDGTE